MGESLFYSWLRHVKECQMVQTNWKVSPQWNLRHEDEIFLMMNSVDEHFRSKYGYDIFKNNNSLLQVIKQGECDVLGVSVENQICKYYAVDVAFHTNGLNYGEKNVTIMKVISKSIRTAMCLYGYFEDKNAEVIFASPKINPALLNELAHCIDDLNILFKMNGFGFTVRVIANEDFNSSVLQPILLISEGVSDTSELFIRSYQMFTMFSDSTRKTKEKRSEPSRKSSGYSNSDINNLIENSEYKDMSVGLIARKILRRMLENNKASKAEVELMQTLDYSKDTFHLRFPLLARADGNVDNKRYYATPSNIYGEEYRICNDWYEQENNNDKPYLIKWIEDHKDEGNKT